MNYFLQKISRKKTGLVTVTPKLHIAVKNGTLSMHWLRFCLTLIDEITNYLKDFVFVPILKTSDRFLFESRAQKSNKKPIFTEKIFQVVINRRRQKLKEVTSISLIATISELCMYNVAKHYICFRNEQSVFLTLVSTCLEFE